MAEKAQAHENTKTYVDKVAEKIISALENGTAPWVKPWKGVDLVAIAPCNPTTKKTL